MSSQRLPEFVIIGAVKAATTWTSQNLARNPGLFIPGPETHFFSDRFDRGIEWYADLFSEAPEDAVIGEKSADYLACEAAPRRIADKLPALKLIVQLRNPIDRAYSDYCMLYRRGTVTEEPEKYFSGSCEFGRRFLEGGLYTRHLSRFCDHFPREQILIILFEDVAENPRSVIEQASSFIGVSPHLEGVSLAKTENDSSTPILPLAMRKALKPFKGSVARFRQESWFKAIRGLFARKEKYPSLTPEAQMLLADYYREECEQLSALVGRDLSDWFDPCQQCRRQSEPNCAKCAKSGDNFP